MHSIGRRAARKRWIIRRESVDERAGVDFGSNPATPETIASRWGQIAGAMTPDTR